LLSRHSQSPTGRQTSGEAKGSATSVWPPQTVFRAHFWQSANAQCTLHVAHFGSRAPPLCRPTWAHLFPLASALDCLCPSPNDRQEEEEKKNRNNRRKTPSSRPTLVMILLTNRRSSIVAQWARIRAAKGPPTGLSALLCSLLAVWLEGRPPRRLKHRPARWKGAGRSEQKREAEEARNNFESPGHVCSSHTRAQLMSIRPFQRVLLLRVVTFLCLSLCLPLGACGARATVAKRPSTSRQEGPAKELAYGLGRGA